MPSKSTNPKRLRLALPATSANLGPAFDAAALAMDFYITLDARAAKEFSIAATGRDREICGKVEDHLILNTYREVLQSARHEITPLALRIKTKSPSAKVVARQPPPGSLESPSPCTSAVCAGLTRRSSAKLLTASTMPTTPLPAGWAASP